MMFAFNALKMILILSWLSSFNVVTIASESTTNLRVDSEGIEDGKNCQTIQHSMGKMNPITHVSLPIICTITRKFGFHSRKKNK